MISPQSLNSTNSDLVGSPTPRIWTPRSDAPTRSPALVKLADLAGLYLDDWQSLTVQIGLEFRGGRWVRRTIVLLVARQNGKTVILESRILFGLYAVPDDRLILHTAQDRSVPREVFESLIGRIGDTPALHKRVARRGIRETNGQERIRLKDGSTYRILAPRPKAFRSWAADVLIFDEAREQRDRDLWGAAVPTQSARPNPQTWVVSNAGDPDSLVLNDLRDRGRAAADDPESDPSIAYLEWSAPDDADLDDRDGWVAANPDLGNRLTLDALIEERRSLSPERFRTERICQWVATKAVPVIPPAAWDLVAGSPPPVAPGLPRPIAGIHISGDRTYAALAIVAERDDRLVADLVDEWEDPDGVDVLQIARDVVEWMKYYKIRQIGFDRAASSVVAQHVERRGLSPERIDTIEYVVASQNLSSSVASGHLWHRSNPSLDRQVAAAGRKTRTDGTWYVSPAESSGEVAGVLALSFAVSIAYRPARTSSVASS